MKKLDEKDLKAILVIVLGLNILAWILDKTYLGYIATGIGVLSLLIPAIGSFIVWLWYKIAEIMGWFSSRIILSALFFLLLTPISLVYR
ncbi:MAG: hypothetical protein WBA74_24255, partial [Cyclobacteriaceae bacterium]